MRYEIIDSFDPVVLAEKINKMLAKGWKPLGGLAIRYDGIETSFYQAMIKDNVVNIERKDKTKDENKNSKIVCPYCQSTSIAEIMYGEPAFDDELEEALRNGEIYLGGCCYYPDSPEYHCNKCDKNFPESLHDPDWGVEFDTDDENEDD